MSVYQYTCTLARAVARSIKINLMHEHSGLEHHIVACKEKSSNLSSAVFLNAKKGVDETVDEQIAYKHWRVVTDRERAFVRRPEPKFSNERSV